MIKLAIAIFFLAASKLLFVSCFNYFVGLFSQSSKRFYGSLQACGVLLQITSTLAVVFNCCFWRCRCLIGYLFYFSLCVWSVWFFKYSLSIPCMFSIFGRVVFDARFPSFLPIRLIPNFFVLFFSAVIYFRIYFAFLLSLLLRFARILCIHVCIGLVKPVWNSFYLLFHENVSLYLFFFLSFSFLNSVCVCFFFSVNSLFKLSVNYFGIIGFVFHSE